MKRDVDQGISGRVHDFILEKSAAWVEKATAKQVSNGSDPTKDWDQGYGFQFWRCRHGAYRGRAAGHGRLDYDRYLSLLHHYSFKGPLLLHGLAESQVPDCVAFLRQKLARVSPRPADR